MTRRIGDKIILLEQEAKAMCDICRKVAELRPYGPRGENVCFSCGMKDEAAVIRAFEQRLSGD